MQAYDKKSPKKTNFYLRTRKSYTKFFIKFIYVKNCVDARK